VLVRPLKLMHLLLGVLLVIIMPLTLALLVPAVSASRVQRFLPVRVSARWKVPSSSLAMTASSRKATGSLNALPLVGLAVAPGPM